MALFSGGPPECLSRHPATGRGRGEWILIVSETGNQGEKLNKKVAKHSTFNIYISIHIQIKVE